MPTPFLDVIPPEIRTIIYKYCLRSPTGYVTLLDTSESVSASSTFQILPYDPHAKQPDHELMEIITLALLRTCKRINEECKHLFWKLNVLDVGEPSAKSFSKLSKPYQFQPSGHLRSIQLDVNLGTLKKSDDVRFAIRMLIHWTRVGSLRDIIINWNPRKTYGPRLNDETCSSLMRSENWFGIDVKNRIVVKTKPTEDEGLSIQYNNMLRTSFLQLLQEAFGGELRLDGFLCFKDGRQLLKGFDTGPDGNAIPILNI